MKQRLDRTRLRIEHLEDRSVPAGLTVSPDSYELGRVLVSFSDGASESAHLDVLRASPLAESARSLGLGVYQVDLVPGVSVGAALITYAAAPGVAFAEPDFRIENGTQAVPNDPSFGSLWGLHQSNDRDIDAPEAWDTARGTGATVVAVIDTGVDYNHPDLAANMWVNTDEIAGNGVDDDGNGFVDDRHGYDFRNNDGNPMDDNNHGTHVAGTIGAVGNNGIGVAGVAWTTRIMALKFLNASGSGSTSHAIQAINYAVANGAKILNNSWGGGGASNSLANAINGARNAGVIFVAAAGNNGTNNNTTPNWPSNYATTYDNVVAVASTTSSDTLSSFSNYGSTTVTLGAPGSNIYSTLRNGGYGTYSGTSMATPHVSGALAVLWDQNPSWTYQQVLNNLRTNVTPLPALASTTTTGGRLNLGNMVPPGPDTNGARVTSSAFSGTAVDTFDKVRLTFSEEINPTTFTTADVISLTGPNGTLTATGVAAVGGSSNTQFDVTFAAQSALGTYSLTVGPDIRDVANNQMNQDLDGVNGEVPADRYTGTATLTLNTASFVGTNTTLQGSWRDAIGTDGYQIAQNATSTPSYATVAMSGQTGYTWAASTGDVRALQKPAPATDRIASTWYATNTFDVTVTVAGTQARRLGLYFLDWDNGGRTQRVDVLGPSGNLLDSQTVSGFSGGKYLTWDITGQVTFRFTKLTGANAVLSGMFFDTPGAPPADTTGSRVTASTFSGSSSATFDRVRLTFDESINPASFTTADVVSLTGPGGAITPTGVSVVSGSNNTQFDVTFAAQTAPGGYAVTVGPDILDAAGNAMDQNQNGTNGEVPADGYTGSGTLSQGSQASFVGTDTTTQGTWQNTYGLDGYSVAQSGQSLPAYAQFTRQNTLNYTWAGSTTNVRALQKAPPATGRLAATWYGSQFDLNVTITDGQTHRVRLYFLDWDSAGRVQRVDVIDTATGAVLDTRTVSGFAGGQYLGWDVSGAVSFRVTRLTGPNAVVSGVFFN